MREYLTILCKNNILSILIFEKEVFMVVVKIGDGMGNQLFNYACGYAAARRDNDTLMLDTSECDNSTLRDFELDKFQLKYDARESFPNQTRLQKVFKLVRRDLKYRVIKEREVFLNRSGKYDVNDIDPRVFEKKKIRDKYLLGYWQHLPYFEEYLGEIRQMMTPAYAQSDTVIRLRKQFETEPTCAVHIRGGDIGGPSGAYFYRAIERMEREKPGVSYIIFTNDMVRAKEALSQLSGLGETEDYEDVTKRMRYVTELGEFSDVDEFFLMASCQNQILSNSTFSTWAAYLNANEDKTVIMPQDILSDRMKMENWLIL